MVTSHNSDRRKYNKFHVLGLSFHNLTVEPLLTIVEPSVTIKEPKLTEHLRCGVGSLSSLPSQLPEQSEAAIRGLYCPSYAVDSEGLKKVPGNSIAAIRRHHFSVRIIGSGFLTLRSRQLLSKSTTSRNLFSLLVHVFACRAAPLRCAYNTSSSWIVLRSYYYTQQCGVQY